MKALQRLWTSGAADADARVRRLLAPRSFHAAEAYLRSSAIVTAVDTATRQLQRWAIHSAAGQTLQSLADHARTLDWPARYETLSLVLAAAAGSHVLLMWLNGPRPGWFWLILPALAVTLALVLLTGSRAQAPK